MAIKKHFILALVAAVIAAVSFKATAAPYIVDPAGNDTPPPIVLHYDAQAGTGYDWAKINALTSQQILVNPAGPVTFAVRYLREGVQRMTGKELPVVSGADFSRGIVLLTIDQAPAALQRDPAVVQALRNTGEDDYNANEAYFIRSEPQRTLVLANTVTGLQHGVVELLESVNYEVLAMGPNWTHVPDLGGKPLVFDLERAGRPGYYIRHLYPTSLQQNGVGTLYGKPLPHPDDETVENSHMRWRVGTRMHGRSMPNFPGHSLQNYHRAVLERMIATNTPHGFLAKKIHLGPAAERPEPSEVNSGDLWINTDAEGTPGAGGIYFAATPADAPAEWRERKLGAMGINVLDLSVPLVREVIFEDLKRRAEKHFASPPVGPLDKFLVFGTDPEDGPGLGHVRDMHDKNWYVDYLKKEGIPFGQPYVLHGVKGLEQPREVWNPLAASDVVFGFNNWLLREYDKWIDSLPAAERVTAAGESKKDLVRASLYSYNYHDVPPNFNLDPRIRVMIAGYPKNRGQGKWVNFASQQDVAQAFRVMLPREPSGNYWILSLSYYRDHSTGSISGSQLPETVHSRVVRDFQAGIRALSAEIDFNFGKQGLEYYLYSQMLWNPTLSADELSSLRDRWLQRAYGSGWREMKEYHDFMAPSNKRLNVPSNWARALRMIDDADKKIDAAREPAAQRRLDDFKLYWYFYYLLDTGQAKADSEAFREYVWKGQMSYMHAMHAIHRRYFKTYNPRISAGEPFNQGPAHYTQAETAKWWNAILEHWPVIPVIDFNATTLADGTPARNVDLNDLVAVEAFASKPLETPFRYNSASASTDVSFLTVATAAGEELGFKKFWQWQEDRAIFAQRDVPYGVSWWDPARQEWQELVDQTMTSEPSQLATDHRGKEYQQVVVRYKAPRPGTYRFDVGQGGDLSLLTSLAFSLENNEYTGFQPHTFHTNLSGLSQTPAYFYIPKGTKSLDLETWDKTARKNLQLHTGLPAAGMKKSRVVDISKLGTHTIELQPGEDGTLALIDESGFAIPHLYSIPTLWAKSPAAVLVPRAIAEADGLIGK